MDNSVQCLDTLTFTTLAVHKAHLHCLLLEAEGKGQLLRAKKFERRWVGREWKGCKEQLGRQWGRNGKEVSHEWRGWWDNNELSTLTRRTLLHVCRRKHLHAFSSQKVHLYVMDISLNKLVIYWTWQLLRECWKALLSLPQAQIMQHAFSYKRLRGLEGGSHMVKLMLQSPQRIPKSIGATWRTRLHPHTQVCTSGTIKLWVNQNTCHLFLHGR